MSTVRRETFSVEFFFSALTEPRRTALYYDNLHENATLELIECSPKVHNALFRLKDVRRRAQFTDLAFVSG